MRLLCFSYVVRMKRLLAAASAALILVPTTASANSTSAAYGHSSLKGVVSHQTTAQATTGGSLPFTGLDLVGLGGGAGILIGAGLVLRRSASWR